MDRLVDHLFVFEGDGIINDFPGNYSQYREWLKENDTTLLDKFNMNANVAKGNDPTRAGIEKKKPSFNDKREFELLEKEIVVLNREKEKISIQLNNDKTPFEELQKLSIRIGEITEVLDQKEMRWLELSELVQ